MGSQGSAGKGVPARGRVDGATVVGTGNGDGEGADLIKGLIIIKGLIKGVIKNQLIFYKD